MVLRKKKKKKKKKKKETRKMSDVAMINAP